MRRRFRGNKKMPKIGYGSDNTTKYFLPNGLKKFLVHNVKDLDVLLMNNRTFCAEIAHNVSSRVRAQIVKRAQQIRVKLTNSRGKVRTEEKKQEAWLFLMLSFLIYQSGTSANFITLQALFSKVWHCFLSFDRADVLAKWLITYTICIHFIKPIATDSSAGPAIKWNSDDY